MSTISPDKLASEVTKALEEWADVTEEAAKKGLQKAAREAVSDLREANPSGSGRYGSWAAYNNDWTSKLESKKGVFMETIYNKKHYQLTHLLENGHALINGGRTQAFPHIAPVAEKMEDRLLELIRSCLD